MTGAEVPAGRVAGLTLARGASGDLLLSWMASCSAADDDYAVYEGLLGDFESHQWVLCGTGGATSATVHPRAGDGYYLVVPRNSGREGSYGLKGDLAERSPAATACFPQQILDCR